MISGMLSLWELLQCFFCFSSSAINWRPLSISLTLVLEEEGVELTHSFPAWEGHKGSVSLILTFKVGQLGSF